MPAVQRLFGVNLLGFHDSEKGVGESVRAVERALRAAGIHFVRNNVVDPGSANRGSRRYPTRNPFAINLVCIGPDQIGELALGLGTRYFADHWNIGVWNWELSRFPEEWTPALEFFDEIWAPSQFTQAAIAELAPIPVRCIPYAIPIPNEPPSMTRADFGLPDQTFLFLFAFDYQSIFERKNPLAVVHAFQEAFGQRSDVALVLKTTHAAGHPAAAELQRVTAGWPNIIHLPRLLSRPEMAALQQICNAFVSLHRAEGFGLHLAEAMAAGKPVIATNYSANTDFMTEQNSLPVNFRLVPIAADAGPYRRGQVWAEADTGHAAQQLRRVVDRSVAAEIGRRAQQTIRDQFDAKHIGLQVHEALINLHKRPPRVDWRTLAKPAAQLCRRSFYQWWWLGSRGRFGTLPVGRIRQIKRQLQGRLSTIRSQVPPMASAGDNTRIRMPQIGSFTQKFLGALGLGRVMRHVRNLRRQIRLPALNAGGQIPQWRYRRWLARHAQAWPVALEAHSPSLGMAALDELHLARTDWIALVTPGDQVARTALPEIRKALAQTPDADLLYSDEDELDTSGTRCHPRFKPDWSPEYLLGTNYVGGLLVLRRDLLTRIAKPTCEYDLVLQASEVARRIVHIPKVLCHRRATLDTKRECEALHAHLRRRGLDAEIAERAWPGTFRVRFRWPQTLRISVIIPNRDQPRQLDRCLASSFPTPAAHIEIVIVENGSQEPGTFALYERLRKRGDVRILTWNQPFNYAAVNNFAKRAVHGDLLLFLNNDVEATTPDWLERLTEWVLLPGVGAVGAKLLYPDGTVQHGGVAIGLHGIAGHAHQYFPGGAPGYLQRLHIPHNVAAVTGACLMISRQAFDQVGGFDVGYAVAYNDVDFCLRLLQAGYRNVWTPDAVLVHRESKTRGEDDTHDKRRRLLAEVERFHTRWHDLLAAGDPYYSPHFRRDRTDFCLK